MLLKLKELLLELKTLKFLSFFLQAQFDNGIFVPKYENYSVTPADMCTKTCSC